MGLEDTTEEYLYVRWLRERTRAGLATMPIEQWRAERAAAAASMRQRRHAFRHSRPLRTVVSAKGLRRTKSA
jgi:uncharacterized damage-inducible protein DinB